MKSAGLAAVLSFFITGLGQIYNGQILKGLVLILKGLVLILVQVINGALTVILIGWVTLFIVWVYGIVDAYRVAEKINHGRGYL